MSHTCCLNLLITDELALLLVPSDQCRSEDRRQSQEQYLNLLLESEEKLHWQRLELGKKGFQHVPRSCVVSVETQGRHQGDSRERQVGS